MKIPQPILSYSSKIILQTPPFSKLIFRTALKALNKPLTSRFIEYVIDFEHAYQNDDWTQVETHFSPNAVLEVSNSTFDCHVQGPKNIVKGFKRSVNGFDRKFKRVIKVVEGPHEDQEKITFVWVARYERLEPSSVSEPCPDVIDVSARQTAYYNKDGLITKLIDDHLPGNKQRYAELYKNYGHLFDPAYE